MTEDGYGEVARVVVRLEFVGEVESAPQAERLQEQAQRVRDLLQEFVKKTIEPDLAEDFSVSFEASGPGLGD